MTTPHLPSAGPGDAPVDSPHGSAGASSSSLAAPALIDDAWDSQAKWWDLGTYGGLALFAVTLWGAGPQEASAWWLLTPPALIAAAWWLLGRRAAATGSPLLTWAYLLLAFAATVVSSTVSGMGPMLMMVVFTHVWSLLSNTRIATGTLFLITAASTVGRWGFLGWDLATLRLIAPQMLMILLFTLGIGFFIYYVIGQADKNATLVRQLRAAQASLALAQHEAGVTAERERVSREIHDTLAQGFMSVVTLSQAARRSLSKGNVEAVERRLALLEGTARENLAEARSLVAGYAPVSLQDATLAEALERLAARLHAEAGHAVTVSLDPDVPELPAPTEVALLRAAQEALTNVRRHANAAAVSIALNAADGGVALIIADDGVGLPPEQAEGYGLTGMRDRVAAVGGTVTVRPTVAGRGTTVIIRIPA